MRNCITCKFFHVESGESGWYPVEHRCTAFQCDMKVWILDGDDLSDICELRDPKAATNVFRRAVLRDECEQYEELP